MSSDAQIKTVEITHITKHPNADNLDIVSVYGEGGFACIVRAGDFKLGDVAAYFPFDSLLPVDRPEFAFLADRAAKFYPIDPARLRHRVRATKLRGIFSVGILLKSDAPPDTDVTDFYEVLHYEAPEDSAGDTVSGPGIPKYDIENMRKYSNWFNEGEPVLITEKIDGQNFRVGLAPDKDGGTQFIVGSRTRFVAKDGQSAWARATQIGKLEEAFRALEQSPEGFPYIFYGEVFEPQGQSVQVRWFDVLDMSAAGFRTWLSVEAAQRALARLNAQVQALGGVPFPWAPTRYYGPWLGLAEHAPLAEGRASVWDKVREGIVVRPMIEQEMRIGQRKILKLHGQGYLLKIKE